LGLEIQREYHHIVTLPHPFGQFGGILILGSRQKGEKRKKERKKERHFSFYLVLNVLSDGDEVLLIQTVGS
jgi:hypothetical protein